MGFDVYDIPILNLSIFFILLIIPISIDLYLDAKLLKSSLISILRMIGQLIFIGFYLTFLFKFNYPLVNIAWVLIMIGVANYSELNSTGLKVRKFFLMNYLVYIIAVVLIELLFLIIFPAHTILDARYLIPLEGMILGNLLKANIVGMDRFFAEIKKRKEEYYHYIGLGASVSEALKPYWKFAYKAAMQPQIASIATVGLVSLPGMMTGQMLGGSGPAIAVKYQMMIMAAIFSTCSISVFLGLYFTKRMTFDSYSRITEDIFKK